MDGMVLYTFQRLDRVRQLYAQGRLVSDRDRLPPFERAAYPSMSEAMERHGIRTAGRPPVWAWHGAVTLQDASALFGTGPELAAGVATVEFEAPSEMVFRSCYSDWNDHLEARLADPTAVWAPAPCPDPATGPVQACVPYLDAAWVRGVRPLPTTGWQHLDPTTPA